jgi:hypothetical protein
MTVMVATVVIQCVVTAPVTVMKPKHHVQKTALLQVTAQTVNLISLPMELNAVMLRGISMVLPVLLLKQIITGIAPVVTAQVILKANVVTACVILMKTVKPAKLTVAYAVNVVMVR